MTEKNILTIAFYDYCKIGYRESLLLATEIITCYSDDVKNVALKWAKTGEIPDESIFGFKIIELHKTFNGNFISTLRFLNILSKDLQTGYRLLTTLARRTSYRK